MGVFDVPTNYLLEAVSKDLKEQNRVEKPVFADFIKTGVYAERAPHDPDWWFMRCSSILYRVFKDGPVGTESLRTYYGGRKNRGSKPSRHRKASGKVIRTALQQLEKASLIKKEPKKGRVITPQGQKYLNEMSRTALELSRNTVPKKREFKKGIRTKAVNPHIKAKQEKRKSTSKEKKK
jgi:small subunit ribosomal protein S19e